VIGTFKTSKTRIHKTINIKNTKTKTSLTETMKRGNKKEAIIMKTDAEEAIDIEVLVDRIIQIRIMTIKSTISTNFP
jgi:hypothetical protein